MKTQFTRRQWLQWGAAGTGGVSFAALTGCEKRETPPPAGSAAAAALSRRHANEQYVWLSAHANLPLFTRHDHPALRLAAEELGVQASWPGPDALDISALVAAVEQTTAQKPAGMMVVGWDRSALVPTINAAIERGIPVICVDADVPASKRLCFVGTDWFEIGVRQAEAMGRALQGRRGKVALMGLVDQEIDQRAFEGFRSVAAKLGLECLEPQHDKGNTSEATHVAAAIIQGTPELVGMAGFDSESGPGIGQAVKEARKVGQIICTCVDAEEAHLRLLGEGALTACIGQKRELFTYLGLRTLFDLNHSRLRLTKDDARAGIRPVPSMINTGTYTVTRETVQAFL
jgi:ribose transport system substrate-binding protein